LHKLNLSAEQACLSLIVSIDVDFHARITCSFLTHKTGIINVAFKCPHVNSS